MAKREITTITPMDALRNAIGRSQWLDRYRHDKRPGGVILDMPSKLREQLKKLTSDETTKERIDWPDWPHVIPGPHVIP